ncbi:Stk1 family PASTA domain-containing Ser/Thr kinase [Bacillus sp. FJAT-49736]|uniref:Stk1 family PASTA domain-containing Ser/Thr kinase n=1 Tax=Bacillus sp. FJAT-49736 TaxID=2833582 RepID=UPI001BC8CF5A|nr:Stk1 family PASTA domain-containing Ser/Thr kinase [Bacillus sp. FJAT-49736]MBS4172469.1 Stk1 family PASTA domain-containing Ser/Thr kinase [Bacillus sp. FJAT-49736]
MLIGKRLNDRYKIINMIGGGGMANVYLARDMILDRDVAIKILRLDFANEQEFIHRFQREAQSATSLAHPNIVNIYDIGEENDIYYIVMEFVDGMTLKQYIQQYFPISVEKALDIMQQLTSAISHAHQHHIIHRDIKPQNILIDRDGVVKITDFGIAMALSATAITQTNSVLGSVHYLSPEQARGGMATRKSDIYSLGIVMFELLTGRLPFSGESAVSIALKHLQSETPSPKRWNPEIPQSVENIILKATAKDPFHRYKNVEEMEEDIRTALDPERINEPKFTTPVDDDATKVIPILSDLNSVPNRDGERTVVHSKVNQNQDMDDSDASSNNKKKGNNNKQKKKKRKWPWIVSSSLVLFIILAGLVFVFLPDLLGPKEIDVPDVTDKPIEDAIRILKDKGFEIGQTIKTPSQEIAENNVIKTDPKFGESVKEGSTINIFVSTGKEKYPLADYKGQQFDSVYQLLKDQGFKDIRKNEVYDDSTEGTILDQDHPPDQEVVPGDTILTFTVSKGQEKIKLKDLTDYNEKSLKDYAEETGLIIDMSQQDYSDTAQEGTVIRQSPDPGTELVKGDRVKVVISKGPKEIPPKTVEIEVDIPYEPTEDGKPQKVQIYIDDMDHTMTTPVDTFDITGNTKKKLEFRIEKGKQAAYRIMRDNSVFKEDTVPYPGD